MNPTLKLTFTLLLTFFVFHANAQFSLKLTEPHRLLKQSMEHYEYGHFEKSKDLATQYLNKGFLKTERTPQGAEDALYVSTAEFYKLLAQVALKEDGALANLGLFLAETSFASLQQYGYFKMAKSLFAQQSFSQAIPFYEKSSINYLSNNEITQRNFELAYCYLLNNQLDKVNPLFASIKDVKGEYFSPGNYYHGVLSYYSGDYDAALKSFEAVKNQKQYEDIVPFYIAELNYFKGNKETALQQALRYTKNTKAPYYKAMSQLAGQIYYENNEFKKAEKYLSVYANQNDKVRNDDFFRMGYIKYQMGELGEAITFFKKVKNNGTDLYTQSLYYLGLSHLKSGEKKNAYAVFNEAINTKKLGKLTEDVLFNRAKLSYDLEGDKNAERFLETFVKKYTSSKYYSDAVEMLALLHIKSTNFEKASVALRKLGNLSPIFQAVYQKVNYARGIQLLKGGGADLAIPFFTESTKYPVNENLVGLAEFWKTECHYRLGQYVDALASSYRFIEKPGGGNSPSLIRNSFLTNSYIYMHQNEKEKLKLAYVSYLDTTSEITATAALAEMDSIKPNYVPSHVPYVEANPYIFIYQLPSQQVDFVYKPLPLTPIAYNITNKGVLKANNYIKAGFGNFRTTNFELGYDLSKEVANSAYLTLSHRASKSQRYLQQASQNQARLLSKHRTKNFGIQSALNIERNVYRPYGGFTGGPAMTDVKNRFLDINLFAEVDPLLDALGDTKYNPKVGIGSYAIKSEGAGWNGNELSFLLDIPFTKEINKTTSANIGLEVQANGLIGGGAKPPNIKTGTSFLILKPSLHKQVDGLNIEVGLYPVLGHKIQLLPNINVSKFSALLNAKVGVGLESEVIANSYKQLSQVNPFINLVDLQQTKRTLYYGQVAGAIYDNFNYALKVGGGKVRNLPLFINDTLFNAGFDVWYEKDATIFSLQANVEYQLNFKTNAGVQIRYEPLLSTETFETAYHYVPLQMNIFARYTFMQRLGLRGDLFMRSGTKGFAEEIAGTRNLTGALDLNIRADYQLTKNWNVFVELNNLMNNTYQRWYNYPNYGLNALGGLVYSFNKSVSDLKNNTEIK